jgi:hypothetical protein
MKDLDSLLSDLEAANRAGVFARTPQAVVQASVTEIAPSRFFVVSPRWAIAATLLITATVWTMMFRTNLSDVQSRSRIVQSASAVDLQSALASCVGGPTSALNDFCGRVDFDRDGDVDLNDFGTYQRDRAASSH